MGRADSERRAKLLGTTWDSWTGIAIVENSNSFLEFIERSFFPLATDFSTWSKIPTLGIWRRLFCSRMNFPSESPLLIILILPQWKFTWFFPPDSSRRIILWLVQVTVRGEGNQENRKWERSVVSLHMSFNLLEFHPLISWKMTDGHLYKVVDSAWNAAC